MSSFEYPYLPEKASNQQPTEIVTSSQRKTFGLIPCACGYLDNVTLRSKRATATGRMYLHLFNTAWPSGDDPDPFYGPIFDHICSEKVYRTAVLSGQTSASWGGYKEEVVYAISAEVSLQVNESGDIAFKHTFTGSRTYTEYEYTGEFPKADDCAGPWSAKEPPSPESTYVNPTIVTDSISLVTHFSGLYEHRAGETDGLIYLEYVSTASGITECGTTDAKRQYSNEVDFAYMLSQLEAIKEDYFSEDPHVFVESSPTDYLSLFIGKSGGASSGVWMVATIARYQPVISSSFESFTEEDLGRSFEVSWDEVERLNDPIAQPTQWLSAKHAPFSDVQAVETFHNQTLTEWSYEETLSNEITDFLKDQWGNYSPSDFKWNDASYTVGELRGRDIGSRGKDSLGAVRFKVKVIGAGEWKIKYTDSYAGAKEIICSYGSGGYAESPEITNEPISGFDSTSYASVSGFTFEKKNDQGNWIPYEGELPFFAVLVKKREGYPFGYAPFDDPNSTTVRYLTLTREERKKGEHDDSGIDPDDPNDYDPCPGFSPLVFELVYKTEISYDVDTGEPGEEVVITDSHNYQGNTSLQARFSGTLSTLKILGNKTSDTALNQKWEIEDEENKTEAYYKALNDLPNRLGTIHSTKTITRTVEVIEDGEGGYVLEDIPEQDWKPSTYGISAFVENLSIKEECV